jgi:hypothetical protein
MGLWPPINDEIIAPPPSGRMRPDTQGWVSHIISEIFQDRFAEKTSGTGLRPVYTGWKPVPLIIEDRASRAIFGA